MKILFARVGYMRFYNGPQIGDERPIGGGSYNRQNIGHEAYNFHPFRGKMYGYFQPTVKQNGAASTVNLGRIEASAVTATRVEDVTVVFFSTHPKRREALVVGWYEKATVFREYQLPQPSLSRQRTGFSFNLICAADNAVLLPEQDRFVLYETGGGSHKMAKPGQANAFYLLDELRREKSFSKSEARWIGRALDKVQTYRDKTPEGSARNPDQESMAEAFENSQIAHGQGRRVNPKARKAVELHAMNQAKQHYRISGYKVEDVSSKASYDLECTIGQRRLRVEVKGTTTSGDFVFLTKNEVESAGRHLSELFVLHSISLTSGADPVARGGIQRIVEVPWKPAEESLVPLAFQYHLPPEE